MSAHIDNRCFFVVATSPQAGKTTVARALAERFGVGWTYSSSVVEQRIEARLRLPAGTIAAARQINPANYRPELIAEADAMRASGIYPGVLCVASGARIIDGLRTGPEVDESVRAAMSMGLRPRVVCVERSAAFATQFDNTQPDALRARANVVLHNDGTLADLLRSVDHALAGPLA